MLRAIIAGLIQGIAEWLPISSQGMVSLFMLQFGYTLKDAVMYALWLHVGTALSAIIYFRKELVSVFNNLKFEKKSIFWFVFISTAISSLIGLPIVLFGLDRVNISIASLLIGVMLIITGLLQYFAKKVKRSRSINLKDSVLLGIMQGFSAMPGISRSGITISGFLFKGYKAEDAFKLSFLMSIPIVVLSSVFIVATDSVVFSLESFVALFVSFIVGYLTIGLLIKFAKKFNFGIICIILGILSILATFI